MINEQLEQENTEAMRGLSSSDVEQIVTSMNEDHADELLLFAQYYGKQSGAKSACLVGLDEGSMELELKFLYSDPKRLNIQFKEPLKNSKDAILHFDKMTQKAHESLGHNGNEPIGRTIMKMLPEWLKH